MYSIARIKFDDIKVRIIILIILLIKILLLYLHEFIEMSSQPISIGKKRRGQPPGSKNKAKKQKAAENANDLFSEAFSHILPEKDTNRENVIEDDMVDDNFYVDGSDDEPPLYQGSIVNIGEKINEMINHRDELSQNKDSSEEIGFVDDRTGAGCVGFGDSNIFST